MKGNALLLSAGLVALAGIFPSDPGCLELITIPAKIHAVAGLTSLAAGTGTTQLCGITNGIINKILITNIEKYNIILLHGQTSN